MPNTGMLDHRAYKPDGTGYRRSCVHWLGAWPSRAGYQTMRSLRVAEFSRHLMAKRSQMQVRLGEWELLHKAVRQWIKESNCVIRDKLLVAKALQLNS